MVIKEKYCHLVDVHVLAVNKDRKLLLLKRRDVVNKEFDGLWHLPSGKLEHSEDASTGASRELEEETGIQLSAKDLTLSNVVHTNQSGNIARLGMFFVCEIANDLRPINTEPDKCYGVEWFDLDKLPTDIVPYTLLGVQNYINKNIYSNNFLY